MPRPRRHLAVRDRFDQPGVPAVAPDPGPEDPEQASPALVRQLADQNIVEQATGMLMAYYGLPAWRARAVLRRWAGAADLQVVHLAAGLVQAASAPSLHPYGSLRRLLRDYALDLDADAPADDDD